MSATQEDTAAEPVDDVPRRPAVSRGAPRRGAGHVLAPVLVALAVASYVATAVLVLSDGPPESDVPELIFLSAHLFTAGVGGLIARRRPELALGWLLVATGGLVLLSAALDSYAHRALLGAETLPGGVAARWTQGWLYALGWSLGGCLLLLFLPDGRLRSRRWRPVAAAGVGIAVMTTLSTALRSGPMGETLSVANPVGVEAITPVLDVADAVSVVAQVLLLLLGVTALGMRWRHAGPRVRRQIAWLLLSVLVLACLIGLAAVAAAAGAPDAATAVLVAFALAALPAGIAVAILRENLLDIQVALSRTLSLAAISIVSVTVYAVAVTLASRWFSSQADVAASLVATLLVALLLGSLRSRGEQWVQQRLFGVESAHRQGSELTDMVARHQDPSLVLQELCEQVRELIGAAYVAIDSQVGHTTAGRGGRTASSYPLVHQGHEVGTLTVSGADEPAVPITDVTTHLAAALWSLRLVHELQRTRHQLVLGREQERLRIRRDLHDGIGPVLATVTLQLDSLRRRMAADDSEGRRIAEDAKADVRRALSDLRSLVEGLRPPALDQLGLVRAVERDVEGLLATSGLDIEVDVRDVSRSGPATEVAAYRIVSEALTNVVKHAQATTVRVELVGEPDGWLRVSVHDDGVGAGGGSTMGVGLPSMSERAAELGGTFSMSGQPGGGTRVTATFPPEAP